LHPPFLTRGQEGINQLRHNPPRDQGDLPHPTFPIRLVLIPYNLWVATLTIFAAGLTFPPVVTQGYFFKLYQNFG
jgi:hypothetical protein